MSKVHLPKGMRDLLPPQMHHRLQVIDTVRDVFRRYGFEPLETPAMERIETLMGKYGDDGEKLIFKVLKRGEGGRQGQVDQALRYDLTVPLARVVAMNPGLAMPFKRYQIQPVWRADRPQRGRFREFYQCDVDVVGTTSPIAEAECVAVVHDALVALGFTDFTIRLNHRGLLRAMAQAIGAADRETDLLVAIDKLDKIGQDGVREDLLGRDFTDAQVGAIFAMLDGGPIPEAGDFEAELSHILDLAHTLGVHPDRVAIDRTLARGLDYYTGPVFETVLGGAAMGSVSGGGRYDGLIGMFSGRQIPAVGVSLGLERLIVVMEELGMLPAVQTSVQVAVTVFSEDTLPDALATARAFRQAGVAAEVSYNTAKLGKQLKAAHRKGVRWVVMQGPSELEASTVKLKDLRNGEQISLSLADAVAHVQR